MGPMHNEENHIFHSSPNIIKMIKTSKVGLIGHVALTGDMRNMHNMLAKKK